MDEPQSDIRLLTLLEAAQRLQVSTRTLHRMIRNSELPAFKVGGQWRLREAQLYQWIEHQENPSSAGETGEKGSRRL
jgi:excisionase family DNA binding protein